MKLSNTHFRDLHSTPSSLNVSARIVLHFGSILKCIAKIPFEYLLFKSTEHFPHFYFTNTCRAANKKVGMQDKIRKTLNKTRHFRKTNKNPEWTVKIARFKSKIMIELRTNLLGSSIPGIPDRAWTTQTPGPGTWPSPRRRRQKHTLKPSKNRAPYSRRRVVDLREFFGPHVFFERAAASVTTGRFKT